MEEEAIHLSGGCAQEETATDKIAEAFSWVGWAYGCFLFTYIPFSSYTRWYFWACA